MYLWKIPLSRLSLDLRLAPPTFHPQYRFFTQIDSEKLFDLLALTDLHQLELLSLDSIPTTPARFKIKKLKVLKLSGSCSFREPVFLLLSCC